MGNLFAKRSNKSFSNIDNNKVSSCYSLPDSVFVDDKQNENNRQIINIERNILANQNLNSTSSHDLSLRSSFFSHQRPSLRIIKNTSLRSCPTKKGFLSNKSKSSDNLLTNRNEIVLSKYKTQWPIPYIESIFLPQFKIIELNIDTKYLIKKQLARGAFGKVYQVLDKETNEEFALKTLSKAQIIKDDTLKQLKDEVDIQTICGHHPFIVQCFAFWQSRKNIYLLSEFVPCGELFNKIKTFSYQLVQLYVAELAIALDFLHNAGIVYRDLKPENILIDNNYHIKLIDFGLSKWLKIGKRTNTICGTLQYMAPEIINGEEYGHAVDWWALGVVACRMLTNQYPNTCNVIQPKIPDSDVNTDKNEAKKGVLTDVVSFQDTNKHEDVIKSEAEDQLDTAANLIGKINVKADLNIKKNNLLPTAVDNLEKSKECKDLLQRLLEVKPQYRLRSLLALERIAMYQNYKFDDVKKKKISPKMYFTSETEIGQSVLTDTLDAFYGF